MTDTRDSEKTRIAHLILVHKSPNQLVRLVKGLQHPCVDIYVHVDRKVDIRPFRRALDNTHAVYLLEKRHNINWSAFSMVEATLRSFEFIVSQKTYDFVNLLSGEDYPLKSATAFHLFLSKNKGKTFMELHQAGDLWWQEAQIRFTRYFFNDINLKGKYFLENIINKLMPPRKISTEIEIVGKSQWITIARKHLQYIIQYDKGHQDIRRFLKYSWAPDEFFFQTVLFNSPFRGEIIRKNLRYTSWDRGKASPKILTRSDLTMLKESDNFFGRKFDQTIDSIILDELDKVIDADVNG